MVNARLCEKARLASFLVSPRLFDFLNCEIKTSKCFKDCKTFRYYFKNKQSNWDFAQTFIALQKAET